MKHQLPEHGAALGNIWHYCQVCSQCPYASFHRYRIGVCSWCYRWWYLSQTLQQPDAKDEMMYQIFRGKSKQPDSIQQTTGTSRVGIKWASTVCLCPMTSGWNVRKSSPLISWIDGLLIWTLLFYHTHFSLAKVCLQWKSWTTLRLHEVYFLIDTLYLKAPKSLSVVCFCGKDGGHD